jgi:hypothetical protein
VTGADPSPDDPVDATCPACGHHLAVTFLAPTSQPLATGGWPESPDAARAMTALPLAFVRCLDCGHVFNRAFDYGRVPYSRRPYRMFNRGVHWSGFIGQVLERLAAFLPAVPTVVEIGHGDGGFLAALAETRAGRGNWIGFDPNGAAGRQGPIEFRQALFDPATDLPALKPDLIVSRHVLEHLTNPLGFLQRIGFLAGRLALAPMCYLEVPCIDRAIAAARTTDFYFEHGSHFTSRSFGRMLERAHAELLEIGHGYDGEVVFGLCRLSGDARHQGVARAASGFQRRTGDALVTICRQLDLLHASGKPVVIWGGTGKSAAFINRYGLDAERFPLVVDSDPEKAGGFVPGTGQEIRTRDALTAGVAHVVIVPPQWRARDIAAEIARAGIQVEALLIEHDGALVDFQGDEHPYRRD